MTNIFMEDIETSVTEDSVDLSSVKDITLYNLDATNTITVAFDESTTTATEKIILSVKESGYPAEAIKLPVGGKGSTLYYIADGGTPALRITGTRLL